MLTRAEQVAAHAALKRLWKHVPEEDRPAIRKLGEHLHALVMGEVEQTPRQNMGRVRREERDGDRFDRAMDQAERDAAPVEVGRAALAALKGFE